MTTLGDECKKANKWPLKVSFYKFTRLNITTSNLTNKRAAGKKKRDIGSRWMAGAIYASTDLPDRLPSFSLSLSLSIQLTGKPGLGHGDLLAPGGFQLLSKLIVKLLISNASPYLIEIEYDFLSVHNQSLSVLTSKRGLLIIR